MKKIKKITRVPVTKAKELLSRFEFMMTSGEILCITKNVALTLEEKKIKRETGIPFRPMYALIPWTVFEEMYEITSTVENPLQMLEFIKFVKDNNKTHVFTDILSKYYTEYGIYEASEDDLA